MPIAKYLWERARARGANCLLLAMRTFWIMMNLKVFTSLCMEHVVDDASQSSQDDIRAKPLMQTQGRAVLFQTQETLRDTHIDFEKAVKRFIWMSTFVAFVAGWPW